MDPLFYDFAVVGVIVRLWLVFRLVCRKAAVCACAAHEQDFCSREGCSPGSFAHRVHLRASALYFFLDSLGSEWKLAFLRYSIWHFAGHHALSQGVEGHSKLKKCELMYSLFVRLVVSKG